jgi:hypothetical protein
MRYLLATLSFVLSCQASRAAEEVCMIRAASHSEALSGHPGQLTSDVILRTIAANCREGQVVTILGPREMIMEADGFCDFYPSRSLCPRTEIECPACMPVRVVGAKYTT